MDKDYNSTYYLFDSMTLNNRHAWLQVIDSPIGNIYAVQYEKPHLEIETKLFYCEFEKAERYYKSVCKQMIEGRK